MVQTQFQPRLGLWIADNKLFERLAQLVKLTPESIAADVSS
jgi:hypothetical protein